MQKLFIALDIDGTIARHDGYIAPETVETIKSTQDAGHHIIFASGRSFSDIAPVLETVGLNTEWLVSTNGAVTFKNVAENKYVEYNFLEMLPDEHVNYFKNVAPHANFMIEVHGEGFYYSKVFDMPYIDNVEKIKTDLDSFYGKKSLRLIVTDHIDKEAFWMEQVDTYGEGIIGTHTGAGKVWVEILHKEANKASALETIRKELGVPLHNVVAIGDGHNDIRMLKWAGEHGKSFAMGQSHEDVKRAANFVTYNVENLGVAKTLEALF